MLKLFKGVYLNHGSYKHVIASSSTDYISYCTTNYNYIEVSEDNYRINNGAIKIAITTTITEDSVFNYVIETRTNYMRCYWVRDIQVQSGMLILYVEVDEWGSNIWRASLNNAHITRCNRQLSGAYYDLCEHYGNSTNGFAPVHSARTLINPSDAVLVVALRYNLQESLFSNNVSETRLLAVNIGELQTDFDYIGGDGHLAYINPLDIAINWAGGLYEMVLFSGTLPGTTKDVQILDAWVIPSNLCGTMEEFKVDGALSTTFNSAWKPNRATLGTQHKLYTITSPYKTNDSGSMSFANMYGRRNFYGTMTEYLEIPNYNGNTRTIRQRATFGVSEIVVELLDGDKSLDITASFHLELTTNDGNVTGLRALKKAINLASGTAGIVGGLMSQNYAGVLTSTGNLTSVIGGQAKNVGGGDGYVNFYCVDADDVHNKLYNPFVLWTLYPFNETQEKEKVHNLGAKCSYMMADLLNIFNNNLYITITSVDQGVTFLQAECEVEGQLTKSSADYIKNELLRGIKVIKYGS